MPFRTVRWSRAGRPLGGRCGGRRGATRLHCDSESRSRLHSSFYTYLVCIHALVLQLQIIVPAFGSRLGVVPSCTGLVHSSPTGPGQDFVRRCVRAQVEVHEQPSDLGYGEGDQIHAGVAGPPFSTRARCTARNAWANMARVMNRYQAPHFRTSY